MLYSQNFCPNLSIVKSKAEIAGRFTDLLSGPGRAFGPVCVRLSVSGQ